MPAPSLRVLRGRIRLVAAALALSAAGPVLATPDLTIPAVTCTPAHTQSMQASPFSWIQLTSTPGAILLLGPNPPPGVYAFYCPVSSLADASATSPTWRFLKFMYQDPNGLGAARMQVRLMAKSLHTLDSDPPLGTTFAVAMVTSTTSPAVAIASVPIPALDFSRFMYYITIDMSSSPGAVRAHAVMLTTK